MTDVAVIDVDAGPSGAAIVAMGRPAEAEAPVEAEEAAPALAFAPDPDQLAEAVARDAPATAEELAEHARTLAQLRSYYEHLGHRLEGVALKRETLSRMTLDQLRAHLEEVRDALSSGRFVRQARRMFHVASTVAEGVLTKGGARVQGLATALDGDEEVQEIVIECAIEADITRRIAPHKRLLLAVAGAAADLHARNTRLLQLTAAAAVKLEAPAPAAAQAEFRDL